MNGDQARARFAGSRVAHLATADEDRHPHLVPITFAVLGDIVVTAVDHKPKRTRELKRLRNIAENPSVAVLTDHYEDDWSRLWWVRADGQAELADAADQPRFVATLTAKYPPYERDRPATTLILIHVSRWIGWTA